MLMNDGNNLSLNAHVSPLRKPIVTLLNNTDHLNNSAYVHRLYENAIKRICNRVKRTYNKQNNSIDNNRNTSTILPDRFITKLSFFGHSWPLPSPSNFVLK